MKNKLLSVAILAALSTGCTTTQKRIGTGAAIGGATGAVIGHNDDGHAAEGALIGTVLGALVGAHVDRHATQPAVDQETTTITRRKTITVREEVPVRKEVTVKKYYIDPETGRKVYIK